MINWAASWERYNTEPVELLDRDVGRDWAILIQHWCRWLIKFPKDSNPALDKTGQDTENANDASNNDSNVTFLAGSTGGKYERTCSIDGGKPIFFPIVMDLESVAELPSLFSEQQTKTLKGVNTDKLGKDAKEDQDKILSMELRIDEGTSNEISLLTGQLVGYRKCTPVFDLVYKQNNLWDAAVGDTKAVAEGYWVLLKPLDVKKKKHSIYFHAIEDDFENETNEIPFGKKWEDWTIEWWKWLLSIPRATNPVADHTGKHTPLREYNTNVIFLAGTNGGRATHRLRLPPSRAILLPVINFITSFLEEPELRTDSDLITRARSDIDDITAKEAVINGHVVGDLSKYRVRSKPFDFAYPKDNLFGMPHGLTRCVSDGYWLFLRSLPFNENKVSVSGACSLGRTSVHVDYEILVERGIRE